MAVIGVFSIVFSIFIFFPKKKKTYSTYKQEYYGKDYYKNPVSYKYGEVIANFLKYFERK